MTSEEDHEGTSLDEGDEYEELDDEEREELERIRSNLGLTEMAVRQRIDDRYELVECRGRGGMGVVYRARDTHLDRDVALKLVRSRPLGDHDRLRERLDREAKALAKLEGREHVVGVYDVGRHHDRVYFTMPYVDGPNLREWQDAEQRSPAEIIDVYLQAARGLAAAHELGLVHRDFKPANVLLRRKDGRALVADFGIAEAVGGLDAPTGVGESPNTDERLTATGAMLGTLPYVSPERIPDPDRPPTRGSPASDQFSFCVALWEALADEVPFDARTTAQMLAALERGPAGEAKIPPWLRPILRRGLAREPERRFSSMTELVRAIEGRRTLGRRLVYGGLGMAVICATVVGVIALMQPRTEADDRSPCSIYSDSVVEVWNGERRAALERRRQLAPEVIDHVITQLDALTSQWLAAAERTCVDGYAPEDDERSECLDRWLQIADGYVALLTNVTDAKTAIHASEVVDRLLPPNGDFCALSPSPIVDFEVWSMSDSARLAALLGAHAEAHELAERAFERARALAGEQRYSAEFAEAYAARAEILVREGRYKEALREFEQADVHAHLCGYHEGELSMAALWAKTRVLGDSRPHSHDKALDDLDRVQRLIPSTMVEEDRARFEAEFEDAKGFIEYHRDAYEEAIDHHQRALEHLARFDRPVLLAKTLNNLANAQQMLDRWDVARATYERANEVLSEAGVPQGHTTAIETRLNLGILEVELDRSEGFDHLAIVANHSSGARQLLALDQALTLAINLGDKERMRALADEVFLRASMDDLRSIRARFDAAAAWIALGDPRGDEVFATLDDLSVSADFGLDLRRVHVRALEDRGRCEDAARAVAALDRYAIHHSLIDERFAEWRARRQDTDCDVPPFVDEHPQ